MKSVRRGNRQLQYQALEERRLLASLEAASALSFVEQQEVVRSAVAGEVVVALQHADEVENLYAYLGGLELPQEAGFQVGSSEELLTTVSQRESGQLTIVKLQLDPNEDVEAIASRLENLEEVVWASPNYQYTGAILDFIPNDVSFGSQYHHQLIQNTVAWDTTLGDSSVIIAVTDDGVDRTHPDLAANIWVNDDPIDGIDNDGNGFIDDINGWDFVANDNDPTPTFSGDDHGTHVAGIAAAVTNNLTGVAGTAGGASILPIRISGSDGGFTSSILANAFAYAIDNGALIANTSYNIDGFVNDPTFTAGLQYYYDKGGLHFNSAGNNGQLNPARQVFPQTLLVANTTSTDAKSSSSNYGTGIDISAPGDSIFSTVTGGSYGTKTGTSMAAPNAAGAAALIWSANPNWNRDQVAAQLLATADSIDGVNPGFAGLLGSGRINTSNLSGVLPAPQVDEIIGLPSDGQFIGIDAAPIQQFSVSFDQLLNSTTVNDASNYALVNNGANKLFGDSDDFFVPITLETDYMVGTNELNFSIDGGGLAAGAYTFWVSDNLLNPFGTALDGDGDGFGDDSFTTNFEIAAAPLLRVDPLGSIVYETDFSGSITDGDVNQFTVELDADQLLALVANPSSTLAVKINVETPSGDFFTYTGDGAGLDLVTDLISDSVGGTYVISVSSDGGTAGSFDIQVLVNSAVELESHDGPSNDTLATAQPIDGSALDLGFGLADRLSVSGTLPSSQGSVVTGDDFETGSLDSQWTTSSSDPQGRIRVTDERGVDSGSFALLMDTLGGNTLNEAIWTVDLSGLPAATLEFSYAEWSDEDTTLPASFAGSFNGDGVAISNDGINWFTILNSPSSTSGLWVRESVDLTDAAAQAGISLGANFQIKFQQYDNASLTVDGRGYDNIQILAPALNEDWYSFDLPGGQASTISLTRLSSGVADVELYDATGNLVAFGSDINSSEQRISQFVATSGTYFARVSGVDADYNLLVARASEFNANLGTATSVLALPESPSNIAFGYIGGGAAGVEPDDFAAGTVLDTVNEFVTLSTSSGGSIFAATASFGAPTGTIVFANSTTNASGFSESGFLRADFVDLVSTVSIDAGSDDSSDVSQLQAFAADGTLLETVTSSALTTGNSETLTISRSSADIAYVQVGGVGSDVSPLDNLVFDGTAGEDIYSVSTITGGLLTIDTLTPADGPFEPRNLLDVGVEIIDPNGIVVASGTQVGNESFAYQAATDGVHTVRVFSQQDPGEYVVRIQNELGFLVSSVTPFNGEVLRETPSSILLSFNEPFLESSLQPQQFSLNGIPATNIIVLGSQSLELEFANIPQGTNTLTIGQNAALSLLSEPLFVGFSSTFVLDSIAPRVVGSSVQQNEQISGTSFTFDFTFSEPMAVGIGADDFGLIGSNGGAIASSSLELVNGVSDATLSITYDSLPEDSYTLTLFSGDGAFEDIVGNDLDGEPVFPMPPNVSGDGAAGGDFEVDFEVEISSIPLMTPLRPLLPAGSATYEQEAFGKFSYRSDVDRYELSVDAGQSITVRLETDSAISASVELHGPSGIVASASTTTVSDAIIQSYLVPQGGDYFVQLIGNAVGDYSVQVVLNSDLEEESFVIGNNDTSTNAQFIPLISPTSTHLRSVVGNLGAGDARDWYRFELAASDTATISARGQSSSGFLIDLFDGSGAVLMARGVAAENLDSVINSFANQSGGDNQYLVRVVGNAAGDYQLMLAVNSEFDTEGNDASESAQLLGPAVAAHGFVGSQSVVDVDWYEFEATVGNRLTVEAFTKGPGPFLIDNSLDPELELYSPSGMLLASGSNVGDESFVHNVFESGIYQLRVAAATGSEGEYLVSVTGASVVSNSQSPRVVVSDPSDGARVLEFPTTITLDFNESILSTTVEASDLIIGGLPALTSFPLDGDTLVFVVNPASNIGAGDYQVSLAAGAITDLQGSPVDQYLGTFTFDNVGPRITSTAFNGAALTTLAPGPLVFKAFLDEGLRQIANELGTEDFHLIQNVSGSIFVPNTVSYDSDLDVVTATFGFLPEGNYSLTLVSGDGAFEDELGNDLDGEPLGLGPDGTITGNGTSGGDYSVSFSVDKQVSAANSFDKLGPLGGLTSASLLNIGVVNSPADTDVYFFSAEAGQLVSASVQDIQGVGGNISVQLVGLTSVVTEIGEATLSPVIIPSDGVYGVIVSADQPTSYTLSIFNGYVSERVSIGNDSSENNPLAIDASELLLGDGSRYAVQGVSQVILVPDVDDYTIDLSGRVGQPIDIVLGGLNSENFSQQILQLIAPDGTTVLATGLSGTATNSQLAITDFVVPQDGIYHLRFASAVSGEYGLVITSSLVFESEANDFTSQADRSLNEAGSGLGYLGFGATDFFSVDVEAGDFFAVSTQTPFDGGNSSLPNLLDPAITIISTDGTTVASDLNSAADGKNAFVSFIAPTTGTYFVRVNATSGTGDYVVTTEFLNPIQITDVVVASSNWTPSFIDVIDGGGTTSGLGLPLAGPGQLRNLPWLSGIDTFQIQFNADVSSTFTKDNLSLIGSSSDLLASASVTFDSANNIGTITLPTAVTQDALVLSIFDTIAIPGRFFDGEWTDAVSTTSGNGTAGGHFHFQMNVLAGDVNGDDVVNLTGDLLPVSQNNTLIPTTLEQSYFDVTADGLVNVTGDVLGVLGQNTKLLPAPPSLPSPPAAAETSSQLPVDQFMADFAQETAPGLLEESYFDVSASDPELVLVSPVVADFSQEDEEDEKAHEGVLRHGTNLLSTSPSLANLSVVPEFASQSRDSLFLADFSQEDEEDEKADEVFGEFDPEASVWT